MRKIRMVDALIEALREEMLRDEDVFVIGEDIGPFGGAFKTTLGLYEQFGPERIIETPISESGIIGSAVGAAATGSRPVAELMFGDFVTVAMDPIVNQAAKMRYMFGGKLKLPLVIKTNYGSGRSAAAQHSQSLYAWFANVPGLKLVLPSTPYDAKGLLKTAIRDDSPVVFFEHKLLYTVTGEVPEEEYTIPFGVADIKRSGKDVTILATGLMVTKSLNAAEELAKEGIDAEVIDPRTLVPLDKSTIIESVKKTGRLVIVDEGHKTGGITGELTAIVVEEAFDYLDAPIQRLGSLDVPVPFSPSLEKIFAPSEQSIVAAVKKIC
ncbi:MAG: alpha-ketoacid dehydrogenase subunit beta [Peptococcales bacterium]|jgi:pyruvate/2-oxoglutarate/acetoin dehydrogenase E1 component